MRDADRSKTPHKSVAVHASLNEARTTGEGSEPSNQGECPADSPVLFSLLTFFKPGRRGTDRAVLHGTSTRGLLIFIANYALKQVANVAPYAAELAQR